MTIECTPAQLAKPLKMKPSSLKTKAKVKREIATFNVKIATRKAIPRPNVGQREEVKRGSSKQIGEKGSEPSRRTPSRKIPRRQVTTMPTLLTLKLGQP